MTREITTL